MDDIQLIARIMVHKTNGRAITPALFCREKPLAKRVSWPNPKKPNLFGQYKT